jgi:hypothetical protein
MDDFLHNLRSGKLKQPDRSNRHFNDPQYKNAQRRTPMDRRKREFEPKESPERIGVIKDLLEIFNETQKRIANAYEARARIEERKARAMEILAKNIYRMLNPDAKDIDALFDFTPCEVTPPPVDPLVENTGEDHVQENMQDGLNESLKAAPVETQPVDETEVVEDGQSDENVTSDKKLTEEDRQVIYALASRLRDEGTSWENIARQIASQGYPTSSGKGSWRGVMVKNLCEKIDAEA